MKSKQFIPLVLMSLILPFSGCVLLSKHPGFGDVQKTVQERSGLNLEKRDKRFEKELYATVQSLLEGELTIDNAIRIALFNNPELQATFQELGIAKSDLLQAGLLKNPNFHMFARFPKGEGETNAEFSITQDVLDLLYLPLRRRAASAEFERAKLRVSDAVLSVVAEVKTAYYNLQAAEHGKVLQQSVLEAAEAASELAERQLKAGTLKALDFSNEQAAYEQAKLDLMQSEAAVLTQREPLTRLLGLRENENLRISKELPNLPAEESKLENLEKLALSRRLDLAAVRKQVEIFRRNLLATRVGIVRNSEVGINGEKDTNGKKVIGPEWGLDVPIFDWQQARSARTKAQLKQSQFGVQAFEIHVLSEVRDARNRMLLARNITEHYRDQIIPTRTKIVELALQQYNFMLQGVYQLLLAKQNEILARRAYIESLKEYWIARADLERATGEKLPEIKSKTEAALAKAQLVQQPMTMMDHSHHMEGMNHEQD